MRFLLTLILLLPLVSTAQDSNALMAEADALFERGDHAAALTAYSKVLTVDGDNMTAMLQRALCHSILGRYEVAVADYTLVLSKHPAHVYSLISRGSAFNKLKRFNDALADFNAALAAEPDNQEAFNNRGWAYVGLGMQKEACADWKSSKKRGNAEAGIILKNNRCK